MINYFFCPDSYKGVNTILIKSSIEDLNKALLKKDKNETFYDDGSFYTVEYAKDLTLYAKLAESHKDLINRIIPSMLRRMKHSVTISADIDRLNAAYPDIWVNCLWGWFAMEDKNHVCTFDFFCSNRKSIAKNIADGTNFDSISSLLFDKIKVTSAALEQIQNLGNGDSFKRVLESLMSLDNYNTKSWQSGGFRLRAVQQEYNVTISDESDTVKRKPQLKQQRYFNISAKLGSQYCFHHVKLGDIRIHIYPDEDERVIYIAYIGSHLDL